MKIKNRIQFAFVFLLFFLNIFAWLAVCDLSQGHYLEINFFNVGQGDAIFIETPARQQILIDGGPDPSILTKLSREMPFFDRTIDLVILTHPEKDHIAGLFEVLKRYKIKTILWTGVVRDTDEWQEWVNLIRKEKADIKIAQKGERILLKKENPEIFIDILNPQENLKDKESKNTSNDTSIVASLKVGGNSILFTGDIGKPTEKKLAEENINADILKIAHHGSKYSSSDEFLEKVSPTAAVISVGKNNYGHPTEEVLAKLNNFGIKLLRTDYDGDIKFISDGKNLKLMTKIIK